VVDDDVRAELPHALAAFGAAGRGEDTVTQRVRELHRDRSDAAGPAVHQQRLAVPEGRSAQVRPDGRQGLRQRGGVLDVTPWGDRERQGRIHGHSFGVTSARQQRRDPVAHARRRRALRSQGARPRRGRRRADGEDDPRRLQSGPRGRTGRWWVVAAALQQVSTVDAGGGHVDEHLTGAGGGIGHVLHP
jgi:hypothetical protein